MTGGEDDIDLAAAREALGDPQPVPWEDEAVRITWEIPVFVAVALLILWLALTGDVSF
jgi:hypothetical protein